MKAEESLPTSIKGKETHWLKRAASFLHHRSRKKGASGDLESFWKHPALEPGCSDATSPYLTYAYLFN
eukprot:635566-Pelagomonas_calceolata.AAC.1